MAFGDVLKNNLCRLKNCSSKKSDENAFWFVLKQIAIEEIKSLNGSKVDSDIAIDIYYKILSSNTDSFPKYFSEKLKSNKQERFRVINRNLWSSNANHTDGLVNTKGIKAYKEINRDKKGDRWVFSWIGE